MTYCDQDCQTEHWNRVHKRHCNFLSGIKQVENSRHREESCDVCIDEKSAKDGEIFNSKSPKTKCPIEQVTRCMKEQLGHYFGFHGEGKTCRCSLDVACELPFALGEVSGQYVGKGLDEMLAHAIKIAHAMLIKNSSEGGGYDETLNQLILDLIWIRSGLWVDILVNGVIVNTDLSEIKKSLSDPMNELKAIYGPTNAWWKALVYTVDTFDNMNRAVASLFMDVSSIQGPVFNNLKLYHDYFQSLTRNQVYVSENNLWAKFKVWPTLADDKMMILLPDGTRCQTCDSSLNGEVSVTDDDGNLSLPTLMPRVGENGQLVAVCSVVQNPKCLNDWVTKENSKRQIDLGEEAKNFSSKARYCDFCLKMSLSCLRCSDCLAAQYCSTECQGKDLKFHRTVCSTWANDKFRKIIRSKD